MASSSAETPRPQCATFADILALPEDQRFHEVLDGELIQKLMPGGEHGLTQGEIRAALQRFRGKPNGPSRPGGWWFVTEVEIKLAPHQIVRPDVAGWRRERMPDKPSGFPILLRPDWVCEVMADGDARRRDTVRKRRIYSDHGVPFYWLLDTERQTLTVLRHTDDGYIEALTAGRTDTVRAEPFDALDLRVGTLFGDETE